MLIYIYIYTRAEASLKVAGKKGGVRGQERERKGGTEGKRGGGSREGGEGGGAKLARGWGCGLGLWAVGSGSEGKRSFYM